MALRIYRTSLRIFHPEYIPQTKMSYIYLGWREHPDGSASLIKKKNGSPLP